MGFSHALFKNMEEVGGKKKSNFIGMPLQTNYYLMQGLSLYL